MRTFLTIALCAIAFAGVSLCADEANEAGEWEEIIIRRRVSKQEVAPVPVAPPVVSLQTEVNHEEPPPPLEPPAVDAAEPRRLVRYFCKSWKDCDYERMWWAMTPQYRRKTPLKKFVKLFKADKEANGGLIDENIVVDDVALDNGCIQVTVDLRYKFKRVGVRRVKVVLEKNAGVYRLCDSGIIPLDMDDL